LDQDAIAAAGEIQKIAGLCLQDKPLERGVTAREEPSPNRYRLVEAVVEKAPRLVFKVKGRAGGNKEQNYRL